LKTVAAFYFLLTLRKLFFSSSNLVCKQLVN
jgi:hypothetical protein